MMKKLNKIRQSKILVTLVWIAGIIVIWEIFAFIVEANQKNTRKYPASYLARLYFHFSNPKPVANGMSCTAVVFVNAGQTLSRAGQGFLIGTLIGFVLAILMKLSRIVEKIAAPYLMLIQLIPILSVWRRLFWQ